MPITGVNYKVNTVDTGTANQSVGADATSGVEDLFDSPLFDETGSAQQSQSSDPMDDVSAYMGGTQSAAADAATGAAWLASFPPTLEEIIAGNEKAIDYLDLIVQRYEKAKDDLWALKQTYEQSQASGKLTADEAKVITERLPLIDAAISRCGNEIDKCLQKSTDLEKTYVDEFRKMNDLNNDAWIGRKFAKNSFKVELDEDGLPAYFAYDGVSFTAVPCPIMDPKYQAEIFSGEGLVQCAQSPSGCDQPMTDAYMQLTEQALQNTNAYGCPIDIGVPEYFWCEKDPDGTPEVPYKTEFDSGEAHAVLSGSWVPGLGLVQPPPEDLSKAIQVKITGVNVRSIEAGEDGEGNAVYHQVIEFLHGDDVICRVQVEGFETDSDLPVACSVDGRNFVAASSVGIALHDSNRASPLIVNCEDLQSTCRHTYEGLEDKLGISGPDDGDRGDRSYNETVGQFRDKDYTTYTWNNDPEAQVWEENEHNFDDGTYAYGAYSDRYMPASESKSEEGEGVTTYSTGIFITGLRGDITGSRFNDVIQTRAVNDYSQYALEHMPKSRREIKQGDPFYSNFVNCSTGGNDIVVASAGDNYIYDASMVWVTGSGAKDENYIALPEMPGDDAATDNKGAAPNQKNFVHLDGGKSFVSIPDEGSYSDTDGTTETDVTKNDGSYLDDWYEVEDGSVQYGSPTDLDVVNSPDSKSGNTNQFKRDFIEKAKTDSGVYDEFYDALTEVPNPEDSLPEVDWEEVNSQKSALDAEMDSFFGEMFGEDFSDDGSFSQGIETESETSI